MHLRPRVLVHVTVPLFACLQSLFIGSGAQYPIDVEYRNRGNRNEGVRSQPVSGYYIELISALALPREDSGQMPREYKLKFYLKQLYDVYLTARERDPRHNYWLDGVRPPNPWRSGFSNEFAWPTQDVVARLSPPIKLNDLAVLARLERQNPSQNERVAPVFLFYSRPPAAVTGYMFTFFLNVDSRLACFFYKEGSTVPVLAQNFPREPAGRSFTVTWNSAGVPEGWYKLVVRGKRLNNNEDFTTMVNFYHHLKSAS